MKKKKKKPTVKVHAGHRVKHLPVAGKSVRKVRSQYRKSLEIDFTHMVPVLNGKRTAWNRKLKPGDVLMFIQAFGLEKCGCDACLKHIQEIDTIQEDFGKPKQYDMLDPFSDLEDGFAM